jgi:hypothetical protein
VTVRPILLAVLLTCVALVARDARAADDDARIWKRLDDAAAKSPLARRDRPFVIAEVGYPRSLAEARTLAGQALLLVTAMAERCDQAVVQRVTAHFEDGQQAELVGLTAQSNDLEDGDPHPAARAFGACRHDALFYIPLQTTGTKAYVTATVAGRTEVVVRFPRAPAAYPSSLPVLEPGIPHDRSVGAVARAIYPFFRVPPVRSPDAEATCKLHGPARAAPNAKKKAQAHGDLDKELIRRVIGSHSSEVQACYQSVLFADPTLTARVNVQFTIGDDGWVVASVLQKSDVNKPELTDCIVAVVRCWRFSKPMGGVVIVSYPFVLRPAPIDD